jgi:diadenosine tetraphosphate (Ap4A) HIT family hydrolase
MEPLRKSIDVEFNVTPRSVAELFCGMADDEQAEFFNEVSAIVKREWDASFAVQMHAVGERTNLTDAGRTVMHIIGEYSGIKL